MIAFEGVLVARSLSEEAMHAALMIDQNGTLSLDQDLSSPVYSLGTRIGLCEPLLPARYLNVAALFDVALTTTAF